MTEEDFIRKAVAVGAETIGGSLDIIREEFHKESLPDPPMSSLLYGMGKAYFGLVYATAPSPEKAEELLNKALASGKEDADAFIKLKKKWKESENE